MGLKAWLPSIIFFLVMSVLYIFAKKVYKIVHRLVMLFLLINIIFVIIIYADSRDMQARLPVDDKSFLLHTNGDLLAGYNVIDNAPDFMNTLDQNSFSNKDYDTILGEKYKILIFDYQTIERIEYAEIGNETFTRDEIKSIIESENSLLELKEIYARELGVPIEQAGEIELRGVETNQEARDLMFSAASSKILTEEGFIPLLRNRELEIYPETITFKFIKYLPESMLKLVISENEVSVLGNDG